MGTPPTEKSELQHPDSDEEFYHRRHDAYARVVVERFPMPLDSAVRAIVTSARQRGVKNLKVIRDERRRVNGATMAYLHVEGTVDGASVAWLEHVYAGRRGTIQVIAFTSRLAFYDYARDFEDLLNGLVVPSE